MVVVGGREKLKMVLVDRDYSVKQAGGIILQVMPGADNEILTHLENVMGSLPTFTSLLDEGKSPEDILAIIFSGYDYTIYDKIQPEYYCNCTREKTKSALQSVGNEELTAILKEDKGANLHCHFCNKDYFFDADEISGLISANK